ncbi:MAG: copper-binding protein [Bacteroidota bacterium]
MRTLPLLLALALAACASEEATPPTVEVRGVYVRPLFDGQAAEIDHEAVGDRMPAMRMDVRVADPAVLAGLAPGDTAVFALDSTSLTTIWAARPLSPATPLDLYIPEADTTSGIALPE